ncbi:putative transporter [Pseudozyma hubeiensis]|nr:putative transporter [Pseudozyma hubeiensis]
MRHSLLLPTAQYLEHGQSGAPIIGLIKVTASSILEVVILSSVGFVLARRGIIDKRTQTKINKLNVSFFTPALLFSKVAFTLNPARLAELFIVPLGFVIVTVVSTLSALVLSWSAKLSPAQRNFAIACAISPNSNSLPVALMQSLVVTVPQLHWDEQGEPEDTVDGMLGRALTYLVLFSTLGMFLRWSVGAKLLSSVEEDTSQQDSNHTQERPSPSSTISETDNQHPRPQITLRRPTGERARPERKRSGPPAWARSFPNSPDASMTNGRARGDHDSDSDVEDEPLEPYEEEGQITLPGASNSRENRSCWKRFSTATRKWFHNLVLRPLYAIGGFMTAPLYAAVISLVVAVIPPLQKFIDSLEPVVGALETAGACSIPLTMVVLGAYFVADASAVQQAQGSIPKAVPPSAPAGDGSMSATGPQPTAPSSGSKPFNGNAASSDSDDPWRRTSLESASASGESTLVQAKDSKRKGLSSWNPWSSGSSSGGSDIEEGGGRYTEEPSSYAQAAAPSSAPNAREGDDDEAARNADLNSRNSAGRFQNALNKQASNSTMERRTIAVAISSRMILTPLILLPFVAWYAMATASNVMDDPVFVACACLIIGSPPALTLAQITSQSAQGNPSFERLISRTIFTAYTFLAAPTTILLVLTALVITENDKNKG